MTERTVNMYETDNLALCPYLQMNNLKFAGVKADSEPDKYIFMFEDPKMQGSDLAIAFLKSSERMYKNYWSFFRNELAKAEQERKRNKVEPLIKSKKKKADEVETI